MSSLLAVALAAAAPPAAVTLGPAEPLPAALHGFNTYFLMATAFQGMTYDGPQLEAAVRTLRPRNLRFPGGTIANNYLWREDSFSEPTSDKTGWAGEQLRLFRKLGKDYGLAGFARICKRYGIEPVWVLNVYDETPESVLALFDRLDELGLTVRRVEFGNEPYWDGRSLNDVARYSAACRPLAAALRANRPGVRLGACFGPLSEGFDYQTNWNVPLGKETWYDAAVFHDYYGGQGFALEVGAKLPAAALLRPGALVDRAVAALDAAAPGKPVWFTEWNLGSEGVGQWKNTGAELLFLAGVFDRLVARRDRLELACFHNIYESNFGTFFLDQETGEARTNASWEFFRLLGTAFADATELRPVAVAADGDEVYGFAAAAGDDLRLLLVNRGGADRAVTLPPELPATAERLTIRCAPDATLPLSTPLAERSAVDGKGTVLPAYSITLFAAPATLDAEPPQIAGGENLFPRRPDLEFWYAPYAAVQPRFRRGRRVRDRPRAAAGEGGRRGEDGPRRPETDGGGGIRRLVRGEGGPRRRGGREGPGRGRAGVGDHVPATRRGLHPAPADVRVRPGRERRGGRVRAPGGDVERGGPHRLPRLQDRAGGVNWPSDLASPDAPPGRSGFFGPSNAAGFGGWCGVALPVLAGAAVTTVAVAAEGQLTAAFLLGTAGVTAVLGGVVIVPGYFAGWVGGGVVRWVQRRRAVSWSPWRAEFAAGAAAGTLLVAGLAVALAVLNA